MITGRISLVTRDKWRTKKGALKKTCSRQLSSRLPSLWMEPGTELSNQPQNPRISVVGGKSGAGGNYSERENESEKEIKRKLTENLSIERDKEWNEGRVDGYNTLAYATVSAVGNKGRCFRSADIEHSILQGPHHYAMFELKGAFLDKALCNDLFSC